MKNIDNLQIKISGRTYIEQKLSLGDDVQLEIHGQVVKEETYDNQDGSVSICFVVKPVKIERIKDENYEH